MLIFYVLLGLVVLRVLAVVVGSLLILRPVSACPACFRPSVPIHRHWAERLAPWVEWRWCPDCGWQGPAKRTR